MHRTEDGTVSSRLRDDRGSLPFAMLVMLVAIAVTAVITPIAVTQIRSTREDNHRTGSLAAAQAGLDVALAHIQAANNGSGTGVLSALPCGPLSGTVSTASPTWYKVTIAYYLTDPRGHENDAAWQTANPPVSCIAGGGAQTTPGYALLRSYGTDQPTADPATTDITKLANRKLTATYIFQITNQNIAGGNIRTYKSAVQLCLDAGSSSPTAGTNVQMQPCVVGAPQQKWAYSANLSLVLVTSRTAALPNGMCVDAGTPEVTGAVAKLQPCGFPKLIQQQWSLDDNSYFEGTTDGKTLNKLCLKAQTADTAGSFVILSSTTLGCGTRWVPDASAGAGAAGPSTGQLVNFLQFGRCLDVTNKDVTYAYDIAWPCKQAPDPTTLTWNQVWSIPAVASGAKSATGPISTVYSGTTYCLKSPNSTVMYSDYVYVAACPGGPTADEVWTVYGNTGDYLTSYRILDKNGYCLAPTDQNAPNPDLFSNGDQTSKMTVAVCSASLYQNKLQKWNAPPNILQSLPLSNIREN